MSQKEPFPHSSENDQHIQTSPGTTKKSFEKTTTAVHQIADSARSVAHAAYHEGKNELTTAARDMREAASATYSSLADQTNKMTEEWCQSISQMESELSEHVRQKPLQSLGIAFGIGLVLGILLNRK